MAYAPALRAILETRDGADIAPVARAKSSWDFALTPYVALSRPSVKQLALQFPAVRAVALRLRG